MLSRRMRMRNSGSNQGPAKCRLTPPFKAEARVNEISQGISPEFKAKTLFLTVFVNNLYVNKKARRNASGPAEGEGPTIA